MKAAGLSQPLEAWPAIDRARWAEACQPEVFLEADRPASRWSPSRSRIVRQTYGQWLRHLAEHGELDPALPPEARVSEARLRRFRAELEERVAPASVAMMIGALQRALDVLAPGHHWMPLRRIYGYLKRTAKPSRNKQARIVPARALLALGLSLMATCRDAKTQVNMAIRFRDGLSIAMLTACPVRIGNFAAIGIGRHLTFDGERYRLRFAASETKTGRPYDAELPTFLTPWVTEWLETWRPLLQSIAARGAAEPRCDAMWIGRFGEPIGAGAIRQQIETRTKAAFGQHVWPHLFRDCAVTELVDIAPDQIGIAADLLGHAQLETTQKHYIQAKGMTAHLRVQDLIDRLRQTPPDDGAG